MQYRPTEFPLKVKLKITVFFLLFLAGIVLLILPADFFDTGQSICISVLLLNKQCYACGLTRAIQHLIHLDFKSAYAYNWLSFLVLPLIIYLLTTDFVKLIKEIRELKINKTEEE